MFELEHCVRIPLGNKRISVCIVARLIEFHRPSRILFDIIERLFDIGERRKRQKVHFQHSDGLHFLHIELCGNILAVTGKRHVVGNLFAADDDACGVHTRLPGHSFQAQSHVDDTLQHLVALIDFDKF